MLIYQRLCWIAILSNVLGIVTTHLTWNPINQLVVLGAAEAFEQCCGLQGRIFTSHQWPGSLYEQFIDIGHVSDLLRIYKFGRFEFWSRYSDKYIYWYTHCKPSTSSVNMYRLALICTNRLICMTVTIIYTHTPVFFTKRFYPCFHPVKHFPSSAAQPARRLRRSDSRSSSRPVVHCINGHFWNRRIGGTYHV